MWILDKPLLEDAIQDINKIIANSNGVITDNDKPIITFLYRLYDHSNGVIELDDNNRCREAVQNKLYSMYETHTYERQKLYGIRRDLFKLATVCPMCGIGEPSQLDHQMPRSVYKSLSLCRLNLVPLCSVCNNKKRDKDYTNFVHPYYAIFPSGVIFLVANIHVNEHKHIMSWKYTLELGGLNKDLADKVAYQTSVIKLLNRLQKASNTYLSELFCFETFSTDAALKDFLRREMNKMIKLRGNNDWQTTLLRALFMSPKFRKEEANQFANRIRPFNHGANA